MFTACITFHPFIHWYLTCNTILASEHLINRMILINGMIFVQLQKLFKDHAGFDLHFKIIGAQYKLYG